MWTVVTGIVVGILGMIVLIANEDSWFLYAAGWVIGGLGVLILFWSVIRDRLRARKTEDLDDVGFN
jgi:O-antigen/teichoic acid export membrane protein